MAELERNVKAREKCRWPWEGRSLSQSLAPGASLRREQEGPGGSDMDQKAELSLGPLLMTTVPPSCPLIPLLRPKDGPHRDRAPRSIHGMESGPAVTEEPGPWGE